MKVDKGVCTTNDDAYFAGSNVSTTNELNSIIKFETVFTTLVENKILAIKRECEQHESKKKSRTLKNILLRKSNEATAIAHATVINEKEKSNDTNVASDTNNKNDNDSCKDKKKKNFFFKYRKKPATTTADVDDVEKGNIRGASNEQFEEVPSNDDNYNDVDDDGDGDELVNVIVVRNEQQQGLESNVTNAKLDSQSNELVIAADVDVINSSFILPVSKLTTDDKQKINNNCDKLIINTTTTTTTTTTTENAQVTLSTSNINNNNISSRQESSSQQQHQQQLKEVINDESLATTIDISLQQSSVVAIINNNNNKSDVAICDNDDDQSSQNTSDIEFSLVSENNSLSELPGYNNNNINTSINVKNNNNSSSNIVRKKSNLINTSVAAATTISTNSDPIIKKSVNVISPPLTRNNNINNNNVNKPCERKTKSCQSTPIFGRHKSHARSESEGKKVLTFQKELPKKLTCEQQQKIDTIKSQTIVIAPTSTTTTTTLATTTNVSGGSGQQYLESVHVVGLKKGQKHSKHARDVSIEYEITYDDDENEGNQSPHGFISSFNQLTSQKQPAAIISANLKKQASKQLKSSSGGGSVKDSSKNQHDIEKTATNHEIELELDDLGVDIVNNKKKKRRRQSSRSESVYPASSTAAATTGLKHCILSRPPNQPIQIDYDPGYDIMYDVSLQIESEFNGDIKSIVPAEHKRHRRKHHHHDHERCRKKKKKRKILVHNLDDKSLKVIDPDSEELPQRAKYTIIATACFLLIMCLLLVGVTLRMAPLIDDMVRQENERLLQDSLNRAKMGMNFTDLPPLSLRATTTATSTIANHSSLKMLHQHQNFIP